MVAGLFVPDAPIVILHLQHPFDVPAGLVENVRRAIAAFGHLEGDGLELLADVIPGTLLARRRMKFPFRVTCRMRVSGEFGPKVYCRSAALAVESSHGEIVGSRVNIRRNGKI